MWKRGHTGTQAHRHRGTEAHRHTGPHAVAWFRLANRARTYIDTQTHTHTHTHTHAQQINKTSVNLMLIGPCIILIVE